MLRDFAYSLLLGLPIVVWLGLAAFVLFLAAGSIIALNSYTKIRIPVTWHMRLALAGMAVAVVHAILAISAYINI